MGPLTDLLQADLHAGLECGLHLSEELLALLKLLLQGTEVLHMAHNVTSCSAGKGAIRDLALPSSSCARLGWVCSR